MCSFSSTVCLRVKCSCAFFHVFSLHALSFHALSHVTALAFHVLSFRVLSVNILSFACSLCVLSLFTHPLFACSISRIRFYALSLRTLYFYAFSLHEPSLRVVYDPQYACSFFVRGAGVEATRPRAAGGDEHHLQRGHAAAAPGDRPGPLNLQGRKVNPQRRSLQRPIPRGYRRSIISVELQRHTTLPHCNTRHRDSRLTPPYRTTQHPARAPTTATHALSRAARPGAPALVHPRAHAPVLAARAHTCARTALWHSRTPVRHYKRPKAFRMLQKGSYQL